MNAPESIQNAFSATSRPCEECGATFNATRRWQRFCSSACRSESHRKKALGPDGRLVELERRVKALEDKLA